jgi:hypothetical protein
MMKILKTKTGRHLPRTWEKIDGTQILDPDGWRTDGCAWGRPLSRDEWDKRKQISTRKIGLEPVLKIDVLKRDWVENTIGILRDTFLSGTEFSTDKLHRIILKPEHPNWWGVLMAVAKQRGLIDPVGYRTSERKSANGRVVRVWRRK